MFDKIYLFGAGGHGRVVASQIRARWPGCEISFGDSSASGAVAGLPIVGTEIGELTEQTMLVTIGDNSIRARLQAKARNCGVPLGLFIADSESFFSDEPGQGSMVLAGAVVTCDVSIGEGVIINSGAIIEHDSQLGDFCHIAPGAILAGGSRLGNRVFVGSGARIVNQAHVPDDCVIGAGATITKSLFEAGVYVGTPARRIS